LPFNPYAMTMGALAIPQLQPLMGLAGLQLPQLPSAGAGSSSTSMGSSTGVHSARSPSSLLPGGGTYGFYHLPLSGLVSGGGGAASSSSSSSSSPNNTLGGFSSPSEISFNQSHDKGSSASFASSSNASGPSSSFSAGVASVAPVPRSSSSGSAHA